MHDHSIALSWARTAETDRIVRFRADTKAQLVIGIALLGGVIAASSGARPTGLGWLDGLIIIGSVSTVAWLASAAVWWAPITVCGIATIVAGDQVLLAVGLLAFAGGGVAAARMSWQLVAQTVLAGVAANILIRSDIDASTGVSAALCLTLCVGLVVAGIIGHERPVRRAVLFGGGALAVLSTLALLGAGLAAASSRAAVTEAEQAARQGIDALDDGEYLRAAAQFEVASERFASINADLSGVLATPALMLPVVSQNVRAGRDLADAASTALQEAADALRAIDPAGLQLLGGRIDVDAIRDAAAPMASVGDAVAEVRLAIVDVRSPWLVPRLTAELDELGVEFAEQDERLATAVEAIRLAPGLLGGESERHYLLLFTSPAEARSLGGFIGNYAEVVIDDGRLTVSKFGRRSELEDAAYENGATCTACPEDFIRRMGRFGFATGPAGGVGPRAWSNLTMSAHYPDVAQVAADLYPDSGGRAVDGVFVMDPYVLQALMRYTGPIEVPELDAVVQPRQAASFILEGQYLLGGDDRNSERIDALGTLGSEVVTRLLTGELPEPARLAEDLAPLVDERRLLAWTRDASEQALFDEIGLLGSLPPLTSDGGFSVAVTNGGASKIDAFLSRETLVEVKPKSNGRRQLIGTVTLSNGATSDALPRYVNGNAVGLPVGTSRLLVNLYGPGAPDNVRLDGNDVTVDVFAEGGWTVSSIFVNIAPGESVEFEATYSLDHGVVDGASPVRFEQPLAQR